MKVKLIISLFLLAPVLLFAKTLSKSELTSLGTVAFHQKAQGICPQAMEYSMKGCDFVGTDEVIDLAVLHFDQGFLIMSAEDAVMPVLAYDFTNDIDLNDLPPAVERLLKQYREEISAVRRLGIIPSSRVQGAWDALLHPTRATTTAEVVVAPLLTSKWNQNKYYNYYCPQDPSSPGGYDGRVPNGCVAVAMSQIMFYYRYPESGTGSHTNYSEYGSFYVNFAQQHYDYNAMCDQLTYYNSEVAKLIFHCGTAVDMGYGPDGSGAYSQDVPDAMATYFRYDPEAQFQHKEYGTSNWNDKLKTELNAKRPVYYSGYSEEGGHAFVCDGYDSDDYFHFNFGWGGSSNGYYSTSSSDDNAVGGYSGWQGAIFNLHPLYNQYPSYCEGQTIVTALNGTLEDGSGNLDYLNNTSCTYLIAYPNQQSVDITIKRFDTEENHDFLRFWHRNPSNDSLLAEFSGTAPTHTLFFNTDSLYITFETDGAVTAGGWRLSFESERLSTNCGSHAYSQPSGSFSDGSGDDNYTDNANCSWMIRANEADFITFFIDEMDISPEDRLEFYYPGTYPHELLLTLTGNEPPAPLTFYHNRIRVHFVSDNYKNAQGFSIRWLASATSLEDFASSAKMYPNPANSTLHIDLGEILDHCTVTLYDIVGHTMFSDTYESVSQMDIPVNQLSNGIYMIALESGNQISHKKIVVKH
jgi:hypothetical protein